MMQLENVIFCEWQGKTLVVVMDYIGKTLSVNRYKTVRGIIRREVKQWMEELARIVYLQSINVNWKSPILIRLSGGFKDKRTPDLANLHKVIGDALKMGLNIDDKHFRFEDGRISTGGLPYLRIEIKSLEFGDMTKVDWDVVLHQGGKS